MNKKEETHVKDCQYKFVIINKMKIRIKDRQFQNSLNNENYLSVKINFLFITEYIYQNTKIVVSLVLKLNKILRHFTL